MEKTDFDLEKTYWAGKGRYEIPLARLINLIDEKLVYIKDALHPTIGMATMPSASTNGKNYHLERLRKANNAYYRWYNDGDSSSILTKGARDLGFYAANHESIEAVINVKILAAWHEQFGEEDTNADV